MKSNVKKSGAGIKACSLLAVLCLLSQQRSGTAANNSLPVQIQLAAPTADNHSRISADPAWLDRSILPQSPAAASSLAKYIQEKFTAPEVAESFRHSEAVELERTTDGINLKTGYLGSSKPQSALKPEEMKALEALASRDNTKEDGIPSFTLGRDLGVGYSVRYNGNILKVRHILKGGKPSEAVIENGAVVYPDSHKDTSILYVMSPGKCQEMLLLKSEKAPIEFEYEYSKEVGLNEKGEIIVNGLTLSRPVIFDATGRRVDGFYKKISKKRVLLAFNGTGLRYPLLIDPTWQASAGSMSSVRGAHTATLLPNGKMLVVGGYDGNAYLPSAEVYASATGTFAATGPMSAARSQHTATLLPNGKVLVVGGYNSGSGYLSSAEIYDPSAGTFAATGPMSAARGWHTATLLPNGKVLLVGGSNGSEHLSSAELYDPSAGTFAATGPMSAARGYHTATLLPNGKVLVAGGNNGSVYLSSAELYDPSAGTFAATGAMSAAREGHITTLLPNGKVLVTGGSNGLVQFSSVELYDPSAGTFAATGPMGAARWRHTATLLPNGKVLVVGGYNNSGSGCLSSAELYDPSAGTFAATGAMSAARYRHTATLLPNGEVLLAGGDNGSVYLSSAELYVLSGGSGTFSSTGSMSAARMYHTATLLPNGKVLVAGGQGSGYLSSAELYDPAAGTFSATGSMSVSRFFHTATLLPNGKVLVAGGDNVGYGSYLASAELYDPAAGTFSATGSMSAARNQHAATLLPNGKILVAGGYGSSGHLSSAELYDPTAGTFSATGAMSAAREFYTATLLPNGKVLVAGGFGVGGELPAAELYDPAAGTFSATGAMSVARYRHTATLLPNGKVLVAGGEGASSYLSSAELYDPAAGTFSATGAMSTSRTQHTATLLPNGQVLVASGKNGSYLTSAELYDPTAGTFSATDSLSAARVYYTATLLPNGKVLVAGGSNASGALLSADLYDTVFGLVAPMVAAITPNSGLNNASVNITNLVGTGFLSGAAVKLTKSGQSDIVATSSNVVSNTQLTCTFPLTGAATGQWNVVVTNADGQSATLTNGFTIAYPAPTVAAVTPNSGINNGSINITDLAGTGFLSGAAVKLTKSGQSDIVATSSNVVSNTQLTCTFPLTGAATGQWNVVVTNMDGQSATLTNGFTIAYPAPTVAAITPNSGINNASINITDLAGTGFLSGAAVKLTKSGQSDIVATSSNVVSNTQLTCTFPLTGAATGQWNVVVTNMDGQSATLTNGFTIAYPAPTVAAVTPNSGLNNASVNITDLAGTGFLSGAAVKLTKSGQADIVATSSNVVSNTQLTCTLPLTGAATGQWNVVVTNADGQSATLTNSFTIAYPAPTVSLVIPDFGQDDAAVDVTNLGGTGFLEGATVKLTKSGQADINATNITVVNQNKITCTLPVSSAAVGAWNVMVTNPDAQSSMLANGFTVYISSGGTGIFSATESMGAAKYEHTATLLPNGKVLMSGGYNGGYLSSAEIYDSAAGAFSTTGPMGAARYVHTATLLPNGKVLVSGGLGSGGGFLPSAEIYNPPTGTFSPTGTMGAGRVWHTATLLPNGKVLVSGGLIGSTSLSSAEIYDPATGTFSATGSMGAARYTHTATLLPNGKVLVSGGYNGGYLSSAEIYDPATGTFSPTGAMGVARGYHTTTLLPNGKVLLSGGSSSGTSLSSAEIYDPATETFSATGSMGAARYEHTATLLPNGKVLVSGGYLSSADIYDPATGTFSPTGAMGVARGYHTATLLPDGKVLVSGGYNGGGYLSSTEIYDTIMGAGPGVFSISPNSGLNNASVNVTNLSGSGFAGGATVKLTKAGQAEINATSVIVVGVSQITCTLPITGAAAGAWDVVVTNSDTQAATLAGGFTVVLPPPAPTSITPDLGINNGTVNISNLAGDYFVSGATVALTKAGQTNINAINISVVSASQITCALPLAGAATGQWNVVVTNPDSQTGTLSSGFTVSADVTGPTGTPSTPDAGALYSTTGDITFNWGIGTSTDPESGVAGYDLQVGTYPDTNDASVFNGDVGNVTAKVLGGLGEGAYYARARAKNAYNLPGSYSPWSAAVKVDWTAPLPNPPTAGVHQVYMSSITWNTGTPADSNSGLHAQPYSFDNGATWQAGASSATVGLQPDTLYSKTIKYRDAAGNVTTGLAVSTYTLAAAPAAVAFSNLATAGFTVGWEQNGNPAGTTYAAEISKYSNFSPVLATSVTVNTQADFSGLEVSVRYYTQVKSVNRNNVPTAYTTTASRYTLANPPSGTQVTAVSSGTVTLAWSVNGNPASTVYRVARSLDDSSYEVLAATYSSPAVIAAFGPETTNYFKVAAENGDGAATAYDAAVSTFVPDYTPPTGAPSAPADGGVFITTTSLNFSWAIGTSADTESGVAGYYLQVGTTTSSAGVLDGDNGASVTRQFTGLAEGKTYYARARARNGRGLYGGYSAWSDGITVDTTPPTAPAITSLSHPNASIMYFSTAAQFTLFSVDPVSGVDGYHFQIDNTSDTALPTPDSEYLEGQSVSTTAALAAGTWYLHALPRDIAGNTGLAGQLSHYTIRIGSAVDPARDNVFDSGEAANKVVVSIASGAVSAAAGMVIETKQKTAVPPAPTDSTTKDAGVYKEIGLSAGAVQPGKTVTISIAYEAWQVAGLDEDSLRLAYYNPARGRWEIVYDTVIDKNNRTLTATVDHFSLWKIVAYTAQASPLANVSNYPNPFTAGRGGQTKIHYSLQANSPVEIKIYDLLGKLVWRKDIPPGAAGGSIGVNDVAWDGRNDRGSYVGAGTYICIVKAGGESGKVKVAVK